MLGDVGEGVLRVAFGNEVGGSYWRPRSRVSVLILRAAVRATQADRHVHAVLSRVTGPWCVVALVAWANSTRQDDGRRC